MTDVPIPSSAWRLRPHQVNLWRYLQTGGKRAMAVWHRRAGKDEVCLHWAAVSMLQRPANYAHLLPEFAQGRRSIWTAVNPHTGRRRIDEAFPEEMRLSTQDHEMHIAMANGATWSVMGSDRYDTSLVGSSLAGIVFSEFALANPSAWAYARPVLEENDGWAIFITTPRGRNHAFDMFKHAQSMPDWFCELLTAKDTGALSEAELSESLAEYCSLYGEDAGTAMYQQELFCNFQAATLGSLYAHEMAQVRAEQRVRDDVEALPDHFVHRSWDLGMRDSTAVWFWQVAGTQIRVLGCYEASGASLEHYADVIGETHRKHGWRHGSDYVPHDAKVRELGSGKTRVETMRQLGLKPILATDASVQDGINATRRMLPLCVFHTRCEPGLSALEQYKREWDDEKKVFKPTPLHDWTADYADSCRYMALSWRKAPARIVKAPAVTGWTIPPPEDVRRGGIRI